MTSCDRAGMTGRFITLEGGEGAGKSTQARAARRRADRARPAGAAHARARRRAGGRGAARPAAGRRRVDWSAPAETLLHFAARAEHVERTIRPALAGRDVGGVRPVLPIRRWPTRAMAWVRTGTMIAALTRLVGVHPDLTIVLDVSEAVAVERQLKRGMDADRYERLDAFFHRRVREGFREIARAAPERCVLVSADGAVEAVHTALLAALSRVLDVPC